MMNNSHEISEAEEALLSAVVMHDNMNFASLVGAAGLSKQFDFIGADLSNVDLSGSDLRGYDFTDADLSNSYGINFIIDETTILTGATVTASVLELEKERREFFALNKDHVVLFNRLKNEYWTTGAIWIGENLKQTSENFEVSAKIAKYLYASVKDQTYKNQILYGIRSTFRASSEYKAFLIDQLRSAEITRRSLRSVVDILGTSFGNDPDVARLLLLFLDHDDKEIRRVSIEAIMKRQFFKRNKDSILQHMRSEGEADLRKLYTRKFAEMYGKDGVKLLYRHDRRQFHDYLEKIDDRLFETLVRGYIRISKLQRRAAERLDYGHTHETLVSHREFLDHIELCDRIFSSMEKYGLPLNVGYDVDELYPKVSGKRDGVNFDRVVEETA